MSWAKARQLFKLAVCRVSSSSNFSSHKHQLIVFFLNVCNTNLIKITTLLEFVNDWKVKHILAKKLKNRNRKTGLVTITTWQHMYLLKIRFNKSTCKSFYRLNNYKCHRKLQINELDLGRKILHKKSEKENDCA